MAAAAVEGGSDLQAQIQAAVQPKLMENGWVVEENDTTLSEYVTMMIVNGKDLAGVKSELGGDLLGVGEDDAAVGEFAQWLFDQVTALQTPQQQQTAQAQPQGQQLQQIPSTQDAQMEDTPASADAPPTGPRSMRNGSNERGRGNRMLRQMNGNMGRSNDLPDNLRRIKGAAGVGAGRIDSHRGRDGTPRGPRGSGVANGVQRMMNGGRGGNQSNMNNMMGGPNGAQQQMQFMQMMEMQANMVRQLLQQQQSAPAQNGRGGHQTRGRGGRGRGAARGGSQTSALHAVDGKLPDAPLPAGPSANGGMDIDGGSGHSSDMFSTMCKFNLHCTNPNCGFAHQSPAAPPNATLDMTDTCSHGVACTNKKCTARHPSPALRNSHFAGGGVQVDCKFYPNCTNPACPFRHPSAPPCRNGADCAVPGCTFAHSKIPCRYNPCTNPSCPFKHADGQKRGKFEDKTWTPADKTDRLADLSKHDESGEELIRPEQNGNGESAVPQETAAPDSQMETQVTV